jgi:chromosome segregation ATPase
MKGAKVVVAVIVLSLAAGLFGGYRIWGTKDKGEADVKQLLHTLGEEVGRIEQRNKDLVASIEASKGEVEASEAVRKENQELKEQLQSALQGKTELESSLADLRAKETNAEKQTAVEQELLTKADDLKGRITALEGRNRDLADRLQMAEQQNAEKEGVLDQVRRELSEAREKASKGEEYKLLTDDLNARISGLEQENRELRSVIDNISEMTQRKQETR